MPTIRDFSSIFLENYEPDPIFAEISTGNWVRALASEIRRVHGETIEDWDCSITSEFTTIQGNSNCDFEPDAFRALFHAICLTSSFHRAGQLPYSSWDTVGQISNFYYTLLNYFNVPIIFQCNRVYKDHTSIQSAYDSLKQKFPHPFNMFTSFDESSWNGQRLISEENYIIHFPSRAISLRRASSGSINIRHDNVQMEANSLDILAGYLRGSIVFRMDRKKERFLERRGYANFRTNAAKDEINPTLKKCGTHFMNLAYRYRTKAHYRDFIYLTMSYSDEFRRNDYIDNLLFKEMFFISKFLCRTILRFLERKIGASEVSRLKISITSMLKDSDEIENFWR